MALSNEVGLRLLLCPLGSNIVVRTACCSVGVVLPVYSTFKAIENNDQNEQQKWLLYWAVYGSFSVAEVFADKILSWIPLYYHMKFAFLLWLQLPTVNGAKQLYESHLRPFLSMHQAKFDQIVEIVHRQISKFIIEHHGEFQYARELFLKIVTSAHQMIRDIIHPMPGQPRGAFEGRSRRIQDSQPENDE